MGGIFTPATIFARYTEGRLRFASGDSSFTRLAKLRPRTIQDLNEHEQQILQRRWHALEPLTKLLGTPQECDYVMQSEDLLREEIRCSARTLRRYYQAWQRAGKDRLALVPRVCSINFLSDLVYWHGIVQVRWQKNVPPS